MFVVGLGAGCTFTPMAAEVMRNVPATLSGAASGLNNALRQVGSVLAAAVIGAVLQARLAAALSDEARRHAGSAPAGGGQTGTHLQHGVAGQVFGHAFVDAMRPTMLVSAGVLAAGLLACLLLRSVRDPSGNPHGLPLTEEETRQGAAA